MKFNKNYRNSCEIYQVFVILMKFLSEIKKFSKNQRKYCKILQFYVENHEVSIKNHETY